MKKILLFLILANIGSNFAFIGLPTRAGHNIAVFAETQLSELKNDPAAKKQAIKMALGSSLSWGVLFGAQKFLPGMGMIRFSKWAIPIKPITAFVASEFARFAPFLSFKKGEK